MSQTADHEVVELYALDLYEYFEYKYSGERFYQSVCPWFVLFLHLSTDFNSQTG